MRVLSINAGADTGGCLWNLTQGFRRHPQPGIDSYRAAVRSSNYIDYPKDLPWEHAAQAVTEADALHLHNNMATARRLKLDTRNKRIVVTYHGTGFREKPDKHLIQQAAYPSAAATVSTLDLWLLKPKDTYWLPQCQDVTDLSRRRAAMHRPGNARLRVGHAPTNRAIKDTALFLQACEALPVEVVLVEKHTWADTLAVKATCDIWYDQAQLGYGNNAVEAWGMGIPVICGAAEATTAEYRRRFGGLPFVETTPKASSIRESIEQLMDPVEREKWGMRGKEHAQKWHDKYPVEVAAALFRSEQPS